MGCRLFIYTFYMDRVIYSLFQLYVLKIAIYNYQTNEKRRLML